MENDPQTNTAAALAFAEAHAEPKLVKLSHDGVDVDVLVTNSESGQEVQSVQKFIDEARTQPKRRKGVLSADDLESFIFLTNRDKDPSSVIFAGRDTNNHPYLVAVLDFHEAMKPWGQPVVLPSTLSPDEVKAFAAELKPTAPPSPRWCENKIRYPFPLSDEWKAWTSKHGSANAMDQGRFAAFIEDHIFDIGEPSAAGAITQAFAQKLGISLAGPQALMTVSRGLEVRSESRIKEARNLENGDVSLIFESSETAPDGAPLKVPSAFHIMIPIFKNGPVYSIPVRLRRRTQAGSLVWFLEIHRGDLFLDDAIGDALTRVKGAAPEGCALPVVMGTPPAGG